MSHTANTPQRTCCAPANDVVRVEVEDTDWADFSTTAAVEWIAAGFLPDAATVWDDAGWSADEAAVLRSAGFTTYDAEPWMGTDTNLDNILRCLRAGIDPYDSDPHEAMARRGARFDDEWN